MDHSSLELNIDPLCNGRQTGTRALLPVPFSPPKRAALAEVKVKNSFHLGFLVSRPLSRREGIFQEPEKFNSPLSFVHKNAL
jgi:hypothetical protein